MTIAKILRGLVLMISAVGIFSAGYFWALRGMDQGTPASPKTSDSGGMEGMAGMEGMSGMQGMSGMGSGMVMVSPEKQQLIGCQDGSG